MLFKAVASVCLSCEGHAQAEPKYNGDMPRYFTLEEANKALDAIRPIMEEIQSIRISIIANHPDKWPAVEKAAGNGGNPTMSKLVNQFDRLDKLLHRILDAGAQVKDINSGLLDFPAMRNGREVYLCWKYGEDRIAFWHEVEAGFAGRQPIETF